MLSLTHIQIYLHIHKRYAYMHTSSYRRACTYMRYCIYVHPGAEELIISHIVIFSAVFQYHKSYILKFAENLKLKYILEEKIN